MRHFKVKLVGGFTWTKLDKLMYLESIAINPGVHVGLDRQKVRYSPSVLADGHVSLLSKPILYAHTENENDTKFLTVGFVSKVGPEATGAIGYGGYLYNDTVFPLIEKNELYASSSEINVWGEAGQDGVIDAKKVVFSGVTLTNHPADRQAVHRNHEYVTQVSLEEITQMGEQAGTSYPQATGDKDKGKTWAEMSDAEKSSACRVFFKDKGESLPSQEELASEKITKQEAPKLNGEKTPQEVELESLRTRITAFETAELKRLEASIKELDKEFKLETFLKDVPTFEAKKTMLERYAEYLVKAKPKVKLELGDADQKKVKLEARTKELASEMFSPEMYNLLYPEKGGVQK